MVLIRYSWVHYYLIPSYDTRTLYWYRTNCIEYALNLFTCAVLLKVRKVMTIAMWSSMLHLGCSYNSKYHDAASSISQICYFHDEISIFLFSSEMFQFFEQDAPIILELYVRDVIYIVPGNFVIGTRNCFSRYLYNKHVYISHLQVQRKSPGSLIERKQFLSLQNTTILKSQYRQNISSFVFNFCVMLKLCSNYE